ncbi:hypothetical protein BZA77DRAFT_237646, partial [Pyronema omphalodes]
LIQKAQEHISRNEPVDALNYALRALELNPESLAIIELVAEIHIEIGDVESACHYFSQAAILDPNGAHESIGGSGPEKFLWLAQLAPAGGLETMQWYEKGAECLREFIKARDQGLHPDLAERALEKKLVSALCGMAEVYMSDLCMEPDAEARCERYVTEANMVAPDSAEALQTLASVRISQTRMEDAVAALKRAFANCAGETYATRISLARLLIETEQFEDAVVLLEALQEEDDTLPDLWYLGGWTLFLLGEREQQKPEKERAENWSDLWSAARDWLLVCEKNYKLLEWEDEGIRDHASELLAKITEIIGERIEEEDEEDDDGEDQEWESDAEDDDEE